MISSPGLNGVSVAMPRARERKTTASGVNRSGLLSAMKYGIESAVTKSASAARRIDATGRRGFWARPFNLERSRSLARFPPRPPQTNLRGRSLPFAWSSRRMTPRHPLTPEPTVVASSLRWGASHIRSEVGHVELKQPLRKRAPKRRVGRLVRRRRRASCRAGAGSYCAAAERRHWGRA